MTDAAPTKTWPRDALPRGTMLHGYRIVEILGRGGFGITYKAVDGIDQTFAVKEYFPRQFAVRQDQDVLPSDDAAREMFTECLDRFTREARALTLFSGQHGSAEGVVRVMTYFQANGTAYIVMEYLEGETFDRVIAAHPEGLSEAELKQILRILLPALERVHANGLLHRDIKPANIFLRDGGHPVLLDFGAARTTSTGQTEAYTSIFTETYAPIEQIEGRKQGPYSDIYALGVTCYKAMAGRTAESAGTMSLTRQAALLRLQPDPLRPATELGAGRYSQRFLEGIDAALRVAPEERPQDVSEFSQAIGLRDPAPPDEAPTRIFSAGAADVGVVHEAPTMAGAPTTFSAAGGRAPAGSQQQGGATGWLVAGGAVLVLAAVAGGAYAYWPQLHGSVKPAAPPHVAAVNPPAPAPARPPATPPGPQAPAAVAKTQPSGMLMPPPPSSDATAPPDYHALAAAGDRHAQTKLGLMFLNGEGGPADYAAAREWFQKAADQHYARAEYELGIMAQKGLGAPRDFASMLSWYHRAEQDGSPDAPQQLGYAYQEGLGVPVDLAQAADWYHRAADRGSAAGMFSLGQMYYGGLGVPENKQQARNWIARAATAGSQEAKRWQHSH